ncbi:MAG TPA: BatA domain-containing protein [Anaeromyxobacteraceae bacterium]|nr:BatA domain-containing protein [Anaeromyxobacteraceae bacterium]
MSLSFLQPALLWGLAAAAIPLAIHLFYRRRPKAVRFPAIDFVLQARRETERRLRIRRLLLFVARTALLAAVALAIARPRLTANEARAAAGPSGPAATVVVLDTSASMAYRLGGRTLLERAREDVVEVLSALAPEEPASVVVCGGEAAPAADPPGFDRVALRRAVADAAQGFGHADLTTCVAAAVRALGDPAAAATPRRRLVVATDLTASAWRLDAPAPAVTTPSGPLRPEVTLLDAARGEKLPNRWVSALSAEPEPAAGTRGYRVTATVNGEDAEPAPDVPLSLRVGAGEGERTALRALLELPASGATRKTLAVDLPSAGPTVLTAALPPDALAEDDALTTVVDVPRDVKVLVVNGAPSPVRHRDAAYFLEAALSGPASPVRATVVDAEGLAKARLSDFDVVMALDLRSPGARAADLAAFVEKGGGLFVAMGDDVDPDAWEAEAKGLLPAPLHVVKTAAERGALGAEAKAARLAEIDWDHPAFRVFTGSAREGLESVRTWRYMLLKPGAREGGARVLARYDDGAPALVEARRGRGRVMLYASTLDPEWSDWTIRTSFLPAMQRIAAWLAGSLEERRSAPSVVGAPRPLPLPPGLSLAALVGPDGRERRDVAAAAPARDGVPVVTPDRPGLWQVKVRDGATGGERLDPALAFAVWPDPRESDTRRLEPAELTAWFGGEALARVASDGAASGSRELPLWSWLLLLAVAAFLAEGLLLG